ncbi:MAG: hypothetical protein JNJ45_11175 [Chthonomonas sp.]|nr:hypothetical protein [Chthonomonas sp.]
MNRGTWLKWSRLVLAFAIMAMTMVGFAQTGSLRIAVFDDPNMNGLQDLGEAGIAGHELLVGGGDLGTFHAVSGADGRIMVQGLLPGEYTVFPDISGKRKLVDGTPLETKKVIVNAGSVANVSIALHDRCVTIVDKRILWDPTRPGCVKYTFTLTNNATFPMGWIFFDLPAGVTTPNNPVQLTPPLMPGETRTLTWEFCGVQPNTELCWKMAFHTPDLSECCETKWCIKLPDCDCFQILEDIARCDNGVLTWSFFLQNLSPYNVTKILIVPASPTGMTITPNFFNVTMPPMGGTGGGTITINGVQPGETVCFYIALYAGGVQCCNKQICITLPDCGPCVLVPGECTSRKPDYNNDVWSPFRPRTTAAITCMGQLPNEPVVAWMNLDNYRCAPPAVGTNWMPAPLGFHNEGAGPNFWTLENLGQVFGLCIDNQGNMYVAQSSAYNSDQIAATTRWGSALHGTVFKIANGSGAISVFNPVSMPSTIDPNITNTYTTEERYPEVGDVCFDGTNNQIFATCMDNGKIYRYSMAGVLLSTFDPMVADNGAPGFAPRGELLWACEYHNGRLYYSVWVEDGNFINPTMQNHIRSVALNGSGAFVPTSDRWEVDMPGIPSLGNIPASMPVSDISFSPTGKMGVAERGMGTGWNIPSFPWMSTHASGPNAALTSNYPHRSRGLEFTCGPANQWVPSPATFGLGQSSGHNAAGGIDYDYGTDCASVPGMGPRVWFTSDYMGPFPAPTFCGSPIAYGIQGVPVTGGTYLNSILEDVNGVSGTCDKTTVGDVELPCPPADGGGTPNVAGRVTLEGFVGEPHAVVCQALFYQGSTYKASATGQLDNFGNLNLFPTLPNGTYDLYLSGCSNLARRVRVTIADGMGNFGNVLLLAGDVNRDNIVDIADYSLLALAFDAVRDTDPVAEGDQPSENWDARADLNGDGIIDILDYHLLAGNFDKVGDRP